MHVFLIIIFFEFVIIDIYKYIYIYLHPSGYSDVNYIFLTRKGEFVIQYYKIVKWR